MKNIVSFICLFPILVLFGSCKKDKLQRTTAEGVVIDVTTQQPVSGALVQLLTQKREILTYGGYSLVDSVRTDKDGKFSFSFQADDDFMYDLQAKAKRYIEQGDLTGVINGKKNNKTLFLQPEAFLKAHIKRLTPPGKFLLIFLLNPNNGVQPGFNMDFVDTTIVRLVRGNSTNIVEWSIYDKNNTESLHNQLIYCPAHDTTTFSIEY
jgi:hypothetical protein